ncbi:MAG: hypothetical protein FGM33_01895 [Candidatus Kapabacteria bacterium]|nr:hypothetical protein [Candidatus Kapabacteria bacterium]
MSTFQSNAQTAQKDSADVIDEVIDDMLDDFDVDDDSKEERKARRRQLSSSRKPRLAATYGQAMFSRSGFTGETHGLTLFGATIGMDQSRPLFVDRDILKVKNNGLFVHVGQSGSMATIDSSYDGVPLAMHTSANFLNVGFVDESGYGYVIGENSSLRLLVTDQSTWTSVSPQTYGTDVGPEQWQHVRDFTGTLRFGSTMAPTIEWKMGSLLSIRANYTWTQVLPRHMFWYWAGSELIEGVADGIASAVVSSFGKSSPASLPVMNFVLRNAIAYGFRELRRDKMNWPFNTAAPLNITSWNVGLSLTF